ncbi:hypothetical protein [Rhizobium leguminosarum]|uniref:hypothetical protein n=1 Tax=Rhizobium leguminosarum TaxID=384 RepID=UPI00155A1D5D|nr:hypothetical protein [Rhizobium leguminosarum]
MGTEVLETSASSKASPVVSGRRQLIWFNGFSASRRSQRKISDRAATLQAKDNKFDAGAETQRFLKNRGNPFVGDR